MRGAAEARLRDAIAIRTKAERYSAIGAVEKEVVASFVDAYRKEPVALGSLEAVEARQKGLRQLTGAVKDELHDLRSGLMRERILSDGVRIDGRATKDIRPIACEVRPLPRAHGVALFTRGETQALVYTTLGSSDDAQTIDALHSRTEKHFFLHYNFPPFSVGEVRPLRGPSRRDTGHGNLAERALAAVLPERDDFPYTIRVVSEVLESNGSSSMATVCGGTLALMDAGVPLRAPVAGIAMGLIEEEGRHAILSDILGDEDHLGDMDFKVAGTSGGITALQMDIKIRSVDWGVMEAALDAGARGPAPHPRGDGQGRVGRAAGLRAARGALRLGAAHARDPHQARSHPRRDRPRRPRDPRHPGDDGREGRCRGQRRGQPVRPGPGFAAARAGHGGGAHPGGRDRSALHRQGEAHRRLRRVRGDLPRHRRAGAHQPSRRGPGRAASRTWCPRATRSW